MRGYKKFLRTYQGFITPVILFVISIGVVIFGIYPGFNRAKEMYDENQDLSRQVKALQTKLSQLEALDEDTLRSQLTITATAVPTDKFLPTLMRTVEALSLQTSTGLLDLTLLRPGSLSTASAQRQSKEEQALGGSLLPFTVQLSGTFDQFKNFLTRAPAVRRLLRVNSFTISFQEATAKGQVTMDSPYAPTRNVSGGGDKPLLPFEPKDDELLATLNSYPDLSTVTQFTSTTGLSVDAKADPFSSEFVSVAPTPETRTTTPSASGSGAAR